MVLNGRLVRRGSDGRRREVTMEVDRDLDLYRDVISKDPSDEEGLSPS